MLLTGCEKPAKPLPPVANNKEVIVVTHNGPNTYYVDGENKHAGLEYDLVKLFVKDLGEGYSTRFVVVDNISNVIPTLAHGQAHFAAADLSITDARKKLVRFTVPFQNTQQQVVYNKEVQSKPKSLEDLIGKRIAVPAGTSFAERLHILQKKEPRLLWQEPTSRNADELVQQVAEGNLDYTVADEHLVSILQNYYPNLGVAMALGEPEQIAWAFPKHGDAQLLKKADLFLQRVKKDGTLRNLIDRYYGHTERLDPVDVTQFLSRTRTLLPKYAPTFKQAQETTDMDWRLLAAISYQESHWDRLNTSPTNVRGMMMLTEDTADRLGVTDRLDAKQSILAGSRYIVMMKDLIPKRVQEPDRTWMALAAYNIGYAHLEDARILAQRLKLNPDLWADVKKTLPLLNKSEYYTTLKYGYASGGAPVVFVDCIRTYHKILEKYAPQHVPVFDSFDMAELAPGNKPVQ